MTLTGTGLQEGASVWFGDRQGSDVVVENRVRLTVRTPSRLVAGAVTVVVVNPDGKSAVSAIDFTYSETELPLIQEVVLLNEPVVTETSGAATVTVTVRGAVEAGATTRGPGQGPGLRAQVGYATTVSSPPVFGDFTWSDAAYAADVDGAAPGDRARDEYDGTVSLEGVTGDSDRSYFLAVRFSVDGRSGGWTLGDRDGSSNGVQAGELAKLTLTGPSVDWCRLGGEATEPPPHLTRRLGEVGPTVVAQISRAGITPGAGQGPGLSAELGFGAVSDQDGPTTWTWSAATYAKDTSGQASDEYQAVLPTPVALGTYAFAFRVRAGSRAWVYCDADGSANGFEVAQAGRLTVASPEITNCTLQDVSASTAMSGERLVGRVRVFVPALTISAGAATGLIAQVGVGAAGVNASTSTQWGWRGARFAGDIAASGEDEFSSEFTPAYTGARAVAARASTNDGGTWVYCDRDGSQNGHSIQQQWALAVNSNTDFSWCNTHYPAPPQQYLRTDAGPTLIFGRVSKPPLTPSASAPILAELGVGLAVEDPGVAASWKWIPATFNTVPSDSSNEYMVTLTPSTAGTSYAYRFSVDGGRTCYGDHDASNVGGFSAETSGGPNLGTIIP